MSHFLEHAQAVNKQKIYTHSNLKNHLYLQSKIANEHRRAAHSVLWAMQRGFKAQAMANVKPILQLECVYKPTGKNYIISANFSGAWVATKRIDTMS